VSHAPRVSVVIPAFQSETRIGRTLARLREQTFTDFEVVVVNDGSTDQTSRVVAEAMAVDARVRLVEQPNGGIAAARNRAIAESRGAIVAFLDDDDLWHRQKLELQIARLDAMPDAVVVVCLSALVDPRGHLLGWRFGGVAEGDVYREMLEWDMVSGGSVAVVRRGPLEDVGGFDLSVPDRADWDLWIRLARRNAFTCVPRTLVGYTRRAGSVSRSYERMVEHGQLVLAKARQNDPSISDADYAAFLARDLFGTACLCLADDEYTAAWRYLARAVQGAPVMVLGQPRRWGVVAMLALASALPASVYRSGALAAMSRAAFALDAGAAFDSLA
jgi:glycosyltransferase involved in cell wall biosynthesis